MSDPGHIIRPLHPSDLPAIMEIWLAGNIEAHPFISSSYWKDHYEEVRQQIPAAEVYVCEMNGVTAGFIGLAGDYVAGLFVANTYRHTGLGSALLEYAGKKKSTLTLHVYVGNVDACRFYISHGFVVEREQTDTAIGEREYVMSWRDKARVARCHWCNGSNPRYVAYHDTVWGRPEHDDSRLFAMFLPETFQAGLSWECLLNKMEAFRKAFDNFDPQKIATYDEAKVDALMQDKGIIRNRRKIEAAIVNAHIFMEIQRECGTFDRYIWGFTEGKTIRETGITTSPLSDTIATDLRRRGMKFIGSTTVYAYLQAIGVVNAHEPQCWCYKNEGQ